MSRRSKCLKIFVKKWNELPKTNKAKAEMKNNLQMSKLIVKGTQKIARAKIRLI
jgi:hypothetical protein